ncbi:hypothetical protein ACQKMI_10730 [Lysinibacillus sp. NPDC097214]|uniref:hypothetical protein n=1 Tax=Lysinibacillus sp. NPDC097214 TaxID=3390584 RepID=UPI003D02CDD5
MHVLYKTYGSMSEKIINGSIRDGFIYYNKAVSEREEEKMYQLWLVQVPLMREYISFEEYKRRALSPKKNGTNIPKTHNHVIKYIDKTADELMSEAEDILNMTIGEGTQIEVKV